MCMEWDRLKILHNDGGLSLVCERRVQIIGSIPLIPVKSKQLHDDFLLIG